LRYFVRSLLKNKMPPTIIFLLDFLKEFLRKCREFFSVPRDFLNKRGIKCSQTMNATGHVSQNVPCCFQQLLLYKILRVIRFPQHFVQFGRQSRGLYVACDILWYNGTISRAFEMYATGHNKIMIHIKNTLYILFFI
jgi:hypothetical protein